MQTLHVETRGVFVLKYYLAGKKMEDNQPTIQLQDKWAQWLLHRRFGGNREMQQATMEHLGKIRDEILKNAAIQPGETVLDAGCGDGLLGFKALEMTGEKGKVIFSDISADLLKVTEEFATTAGYGSRVQFLQCPIEDMSAIPSGSVNVVVMRSVLIYVADKQKAFDEIYRVLAPMGRLSFLEPINKFMVEERGKDSFFGVDTTAMRPQWEKVRAVYNASRGTARENDPMINFDERDLWQFAKRAGFGEVHMQYEAHLTPGKKISNWEAFYRSSPNPNAPTFEEAVNKALAPEEKEEFIRSFRQAMEEGNMLNTLALAYLTAKKEWKMPDSI